MRTYLMHMADHEPVRLVFNPEDGSAITYYGDGRWSGCAPVPDDEYHAAVLGVTPAEHRLMHELAHHLVGFAFYGSIYGSPIIYRDAQHVEQPARDAELEEWMVTALCYAAYSRNAAWGAILDLSRNTDVARLQDMLCWLMHAPDGSMVHVVV